MIAIKRRNAYTLRKYYVSNNDDVNAILAAFELEVQPPNLRESFKQTFFPSLHRQITQTQRVTETGTTVTTTRRKNQPSRLGTEAGRQVTYTEAFNRFYNIELYNSDYESVITKNTEGNFWVTLIREAEVSLSNLLRIDNIYSLERTNQMKQQIFLVFVAEAEALKETDRGYGIETDIVIVRAKSRTYHFLGEFEMNAAIKAGLNDLNNKLNDLKGGGSIQSGMTFKAYRRVIMKVTYGKYVEIDGRIVLDENLVEESTSLRSVTLDILLSDGVKPVTIYYRGPYISPPPEISRKIAGDSRDLSREQLEEDFTREENKYRQMSLLATAQFDTQGMTDAERNEKYGASINQMLTVQNEIFGLQRHQNISTARVTRATANMLNYGWNELITSEDYKKYIKHISNNLVNIERARITRILNNSFIQANTNKAIPGRTYEAKRKFLIERGTREADYSQKRGKTQPSLVNIREMERQAIQAPETEALLVQENAELLAEAINADIYRQDIIEEVKDQQLMEDQVNYQYEQDFGEMQNILEDEEEFLYDQDEYEYETKDDFNNNGGGHYLDMGLLKTKKGFTNIKNDDEFCLLYCIIAYFDPPNRNKSSSLKHYQNKISVIAVPKNFNFRAPTEIQWKKLEEKNNISINILDLIKPINELEAEDVKNEKKQFREDLFIPCRCSKYEPLPQEGIYPKKDQRNITLLRLVDTLKNQSHFVLIHDVKAFCSGKIPCLTCFQLFPNTTSIDYLYHIHLCSGRKEQLIIYPTKIEDHYYKFKNYKNSNYHKTVIYADFETTNANYDDIQVMDKTEILKKMTANSIGIYYHSENNRSSYKSIHSPDPEYLLNQFKDILLKFSIEHINTTRFYEKDLSVPMISSFIRCSVCADNRTQLYRMESEIRKTEPLVMCFKCKSAQQLHTFRIPIIFHNLRGFDGHLIFASFAKDPRFLSKVIAESTEKFKSMSFFYRPFDESKFVVEFVFIDSFLFTTCSLDAFIRSYTHDLDGNLLPEEKLKENFSATYSKMENKRLFVDSLRKGVYPYDFVDSYEKLINTMKYPEIEDFKSSLSSSKKRPMLFEDYIWGKQMYDKLGCESLLDYHLFYLQMDVMLLADCFNRYREMEYKEKRLDLLWYYGIPGFAIDASLLYLLRKEHIYNKPTKLEVPYNDFLVNVAEKHMRGGICFPSQRYCEAGYDEKTKEYKEILYIDGNSLYPTSMRFPLPTNSYDIINNDGIDLDAFNQYMLENDGLSSNKGYIYIVDLTIDEDLHDKFDSYPPCPIKRLVKEMELSQYQKQFNKVLDFEKLVCDLEDKKEYVIHHFLLHVYVKHGVRITKIHSMLRFNQQAWWKDEIDLNIKKRIEAKTESEKFAKKIECNSKYGKMAETDLNKFDLKIINNEAQINDIICHPLYDGNFSIIDKDLVLVQMKKPFIQYKRPLFIGTTILDVSKAIMFDFFYTEIRKFTQIHTRVLYTDTDSFIIEFKSSFPFNLYKDVVIKLANIDYSAYKDDHEIFDSMSYEEISYLKKTTKGQCGRFKDEAPSGIKKGIFLKSKSYCYTYKNGKEVNKAKGIMEKLMWSEYYDCLFDKKVITCDQTSIRSRKHNLFVESVNKIAIDPFDSKRYYLDNINSLAFGHADIKVHQACSGELEIGSDNDL